ncbi:MAG: DUF484 family protein [Phenylobacterium sp.]|uniref:DUF484 family protein n=1 Tax=Phenylobacterium sp. TaxID=1871053 RepID=UPI00271C60BA|nr:DUF484 family protein [Phenylobacterium sp.]MDO8910752.1 DUF484 family protein [Phenylobacterium sp.]MDP3100960.1 DUF484 family protein [Phenylobacterium sp.]MDP3866910.1 DUF484 family protein [Phenylobacterium sp.]HQT54323.1 DUF484 family protein [Phenylobacterium sp.]
MDLGVGLKDQTLGPDEVRRFLADNREFLLSDTALMAQLGLRPDAANVVEFGPAALARVHEAHKKESKARKHLEATARANFAAQAQTHGAVVDLLDSRNHADLARRVDELAQLRFGLAAGVVALEGPDRTPAGWRVMAEGQIDLVIGHQRVALMGFQPTALGLFGERAPQIRSMAMVRMAIWEPARTGLLAFGSADEHGFTEDMGAELVAFLARVVERTAERWPVL